MERILLNVIKREKIGKNNCRRLRKKGLIPAILYTKGAPSINLSIDKKEISKLLTKKVEKHALIDLKIENIEQKKLVIIQEIQYHPTKDTFLHIDFHQIALKEKIRTTTAIKLIGKPQGEKGVPTQLIRELKIQCFPDDIPAYIEIDISCLQIKESLRIKDLKLKKEIEILDDENTVIVSILPPVKEEVVLPIKEEKKEPELVAKKEKEEKEIS